MTKGISKIMATVLILLIVIALAGLAWLFFSGLFKSVTTSWDVGYGNASRRFIGGLNIENVNPKGGTLTLRNSGQVSLSNFKVYVDNTEIKSDPRTLEPGSTMNIDLELDEGTYEIFVTSDNANSFTKKVDIITPCEIYIYQSMMPYAIDKSNTYYCLSSDLSVAYTNAINFSSGIQNSTLDCLGYTLDGMVENHIGDCSLSYIDSSNSKKGIYLTGSNTRYNTIKNCNITRFDHGIHLYASNNEWYSGPQNNTIINNYVSNHCWGIRIKSSSNNTIINNIAYNNTNRGFTIFISYFDNIINNTAYNQYVIPNQYGFYIDSVQNSTVFNNLAYNNNRSYIIYDDPNFYKGNKYNIIKNNVGKNSVIGFMISSTGTTDNEFVNNTASNNENGFSTSWDRKNKYINNTLNENSYAGFSLSTSNNDTFFNNMITDTNDGRGFRLDLGSNNNNFTDNIVNVYRGFLIVDGNNNSIAGGSISGGFYDYFIQNAGDLNNFTNTNFTSAKKIYFEYTTSWFNYNNETTGNIWLKTNVSASAIITRKLTSWSQNLIQWNDTSSTAITARYNITGLLTNTNYNVYNNTIPAYIINSGSNGEISFTINLSLNQEHNITVQKV